MSLVIDGYTPPSTEVALEQGVTFEYELPFGTISIRSKMASRENTKFRIAMQNHANWAERRKNLGNTADKAAEEKFVGLAYDTLVIDWSTTIKSEGKPIEATKENFVALMTSSACSKVFNVYLQDAGDEEHFRAVTADEMGKSSAKQSPGSSAGQTSATG